MNKPVLSNWPLFFGLTMIMIGNGLQGSLLGIRASIEGFDSFTTGIVMSLFYIGFVIGSRISPKLIRDAGHIRVFAALASLASATVLTHGIIIDPWFWGIVRVITGFSYAGLYIVIESWLNDASDNKNRGRLMAAYMLLTYLGMVIGQFLLNLAPPEDIELFIVTSVLVSLALVPIALSKRPAPQLRVPKSISLKGLFAVSPLGVLGMAASGMIAGTFFGLGAVYATEAGYSTTETSIFMSAIILGGVAAQIPIGWLSDRFDRRIIMTGVILCIAILAHASFLIEEDDFIFVTIKMFFMGGLGLSIYGLALAHTNDHLEKDEITAASAGLVLINGIGASLGPVLASSMMGILGTAAFFLNIALITSITFLFALYRMKQAPAVPMEDQSSFTISPVRASAPMTSSLMKEQVSNDN